MAKKASANSSSPVPTGDEQKKRKKQAKREAKVMLEVEEAKGDVQKAEKKVAKAQALLEARTAHLRSLEESLSEIRTPQEETEVSAPDVGFDHQGGQPEPEEETVVSALDAGSDSQEGQPESEFNTASSVQQETVSAEQES
jgi:hypothetical protein